MYRLWYTFSQVIKLLPYGLYWKMKFLELEFTTTRRQKCVSWHSGRGGLYETTSMIWRFSYIYANLIRVSLDLNKLLERGTLDLVQSCMILGFSIQSRYFTFPLQHIRCHDIFSRLCWLYYSHKVMRSDYFYSSSWSQWKFCTQGLRIFAFFMGIEVKKLEMFCFSPRKNMLLIYLLELVWVGALSLINDTTLGPDDNTQYISMVDIDTNLSILACTSDGTLDNC